jgi:integrase/recombinase XerD
MPKRGESKARPFIGDVNDEQGMGWRMLQYLEWMKVHNYSTETIGKQQTGLRRFVGWCWERELSRPETITRPILERYQRHLYQSRTKNDRPLSFATQHTLLIPVRGMFAWLTKQNYLVANPAADLDLPRREQRLPKAVLTASEAEAVINQTESHSEMGIRDRAILETLYSTGMRRAELVALKIADLDSERGTILINQGKGKKDRIIPIGDRAIAWIEKYLLEVRPELVAMSGVDDRRIFLTRNGESLTLSLVSRMVKGYVDAAQIGKSGGCHLFRHTCATLMLENGADIRYIQQLLGHADLSTTEIYTRISIRTLKAIHTATHPARLERTQPAEAPAVPQLNVAANISDPSDRR